MQICSEKTGQMRAVFYSAAHLCEEQLKRHIASSEHFRCCNYAVIKETDHKIISETLVISVVLTSTHSSSQLTGAAL